MSLDVDEVLDMFSSNYFDADHNIHELCEIPADYSCMQYHLTTKNHVDGFIDRISDLPDFILCKILSCLPTKSAMAAKILSTRWGTLFPYFWVSPIVIELSDTCKNNRQVYKFTDQLLHKTLPCLDVLNLTCMRCVDAKKISWVRAAVQLNVRELSLKSYISQRHSEDLFRILNGSTTLTRLELELGDIFIECSVDGFVLPNLKSLVLYGTRLYTEGDNHRYFLSNLTNYFPALESLSLLRCYLRGHNDPSFRVSIRCPRLKNLTIENRNQVWLYSLEIYTPNLQVLICKGFAGANCTVSYFKSLVSADIDVEYFKSSSLEKIIKACSKTVHLSLAACVINALYNTRVKLPVFKNLRRLALGYAQSQGWEILAGLLCNAHNLQSLAFKPGFNSQYGGYSEFKSFVQNRPLLCLERHLKEVELCAVEGRKDETKLAEYFLTKGKVIRTLVLHCPPFMIKSIQKGKLGMLSRDTDSKLIFQLST